MKNLIITLLVLLLSLTSCKEKEDIISVPLKFRRVKY